VNSVPATIDRTVIEERFSMPNPRGHRPLPSNITRAGARVFRKPDPPYGHLDWDGWRESSRPLRIQPFGMRRLYFSRLVRSPGPQEELLPYEVMHRGRVPHRQHPRIGPGVVADDADRREGARRYRRGAARPPDPRCGPPARRRRHYPKDFRSGNATRSQPSRPADPAVP